MECFVNDEFVVWVDESKEASKPPNARGAKGLPKPPGAPPSGPIDPNTGKPLFSILGKLGVAFGPGIGGAGIYRNKLVFVPIDVAIMYYFHSTVGKDAGANKECPYHVMSNGTIVKKCDNDPSACSVCLISRRRREEINFLYIELRFISLDSISIIF